MGALGTPSQVTNSLAGKTTSKGTPLTSIQNVSASQLAPGGGANPAAGSTAAVAAQLAGATTVGFGHATGEVLDPVSNQWETGQQYRATLDALGGSSQGYSSGLSLLAQVATLPGLIATVVSSATKAISETASAVNVNLPGNDAVSQNIAAQANQQTFVPGVDNNTLIWVGIGVLAGGLVLVLVLK